MPVQLPSKRVWRKYRKLWRPDWPPTPEAFYTPELPPETRRKLRRRERRHDDKKGE